MVFPRKLNKDKRASETCMVICKYVSQKVCPTINVIKQDNKERIRQIKSTMKNTRDNAINKGIPFYEGTIMKEHQWLFKQWYPC